MAGKFSFLVGLGAGYVLGSQSGRERYDQVASKARQLWQDPAVREKVGQAQQIVQETAGHAGQAMKSTGTNRIRGEGFLRARACKVWVRCSSPEQSEMRLLRRL